MQKSFNYLKKNNKNMSCYTLDNFIDINYVKNINECNITNTTISK